jgi:hypothetical protein
MSGKAPNGNAIRAAKTRGAAEQLAAEAGRSAAEQQALPGIQPPARIALGGRPPGSGAHQRWRQLFVERFGSPLVALGSVMDRPIADLAVELGCTRLEAAEFWLRAVGEVLPYVHPKLPSDTAGAGAPAVPISIVVSAEGAAKVGVTGPMAGSGGVLILTPEVEAGT